MYTEKIVIKNKTGLHARPASELVELSSKFQSEIILMVEDDDEVNAKSIISVLSGGIMPDTEVLLQVEGTDEKEAGAALSEFLHNLPD
ncbi:HPr family phosphocarrier protein [Pseudoflavonifractor sp. An85]|uniref:HPr family phosphocarrier protein n=1 Tax=Pseudoflavonifractor sp. An85 TaxID=1965661 RepID=UPI000B385C39|nr:HPr family phosphocarrier protein [Pseudoflavonifractor sp. An85]OUN26417.1 hypothetical protein B5G37_01305 [Pseudoflavonifractor sp. An85]